MGGSTVINHRAHQDVEDAELELISALRELHERRLGTALERMEALTRKKPKFKLAQLVYADLLRAQSAPLRRFGNAKKPPLARLAKLREELEARVGHHRAAPHDGKVPESLLQLSTSQKRAIVVDVTESRLYLFENQHGEPELVKDYYVSTGKNGPHKLREGDQKTPVGVYFVTRRISPRKLPDLYGSGALPVNYPNEWDRRLGRTGYGIWLHGVPSSTYSRAPYASDGCLALPNSDLSSIWDLLEPRNTAVVIGDRINWVERGELSRRRSEFVSRFERWHQDWESRKHTPYARHYSTEFRASNKDYESWLTYKRRVNAKKEYIKVKVSDLSVFGYPGEPDMLVVSFDQDYRSNNHSNREQKRQYWRRERDGAWRILYEGTPKLRPEHIRGMPYSARPRLSAMR